MKIHLRVASLCDPIILEIIRIRLGFYYTLFWLDHTVGQSVFFRIGYGFFHAIEKQIDLVRRAFLAYPAHQGINRFCGIALKLQLPQADFATAGLHGVFSGLVDFDLHERCFVFGVSCLEKSLPKHRTLNTKHWAQSTAFLRIALFEAIFRRFPGWPATAGIPRHA